MKLAVIFPGQGSQAVGMGLAMAKAFPEAAAVFETVDRILGVKLSRLMWEGPEEELVATVNAQPAIVTASLACWAALAGRGAAPAYVAGHSVGEYAALAANGVLTLASTVRLVRGRGECMFRSGQERPGTMAAVLGLDHPAVEEVCRGISSGHRILDVANLNGPGQIVISGDVDAVEAAEPLLVGRGAKKVVRLPVSGAFHSGLMASAQAEFAVLLDGCVFRDARVPIVSNVTAAPLVTGSEVREVMKRQIREPVRWEETVRRLAAEGVDVMLEVGPGQVLSGLVKRIAREIRVIPVGDPPSFEAALAQLADDPHDDHPAKITGHHPRPSSTNFGDGRCPGRARSAGNDTDAEFPAAPRR